MREIRRMTSEYEGYCRDESRSVGYADTISFPESEEEVCAILKELWIAGTRAEAPIPVTIQGGRTGLAAAAVPYGGHVMNLGKMNRILGMRREGERCYVRVEPGVVLSVLRKAIEDRNMDTGGWTEEDREVYAGFVEDRPYFFPTDPTETSACLGGMAACNASGARTFMYGSARDHISGLHVALCDGSLLTLRRGECRAVGRKLDLRGAAAGDSLSEKAGTAEAPASAPRPCLSLTLPSYVMPHTKNASGYYIADDMDAVDLFVGSDGTLGVLTEIEVELLPLPAVVWGISCFLPSETRAVDFTEQVRGSLSGVAALEYFDASALEILRTQKQKSSAFSALPDIPAGADCCVYVELHGEQESEVRERLCRLGQILTASGGRESDTWVARTQLDRETQQFFRHAVPESVNMLIDERKKKDPVITKLAADMSVPDTHLAEVVAFYRRSLAENHLETAIWGHIGNNHLHVNILPANAEDYRRGKALYAAWAETITRMGGAVSAEHGVGKLKRDYLTVMYGEKHIREMARLKRQLDPCLIFGRGNLFAPEMAEKEENTETAVPAAAAEKAGATEYADNHRRMKIAVCVKAVPSSTKIRLDPVTHTLIRDGRQSVINPFDSSALEMAVRIKEKHGGSVTVISMGIPATETLLRDCLSRGADHAVLLSDRAFAGADTLATSYALGCELGQEDGRQPYPGTPYSLILCGKMAVDGDTAQIGPEIAGLLGIPCLTDVTAIREITEDRIRVQRQTDGGEVAAECPLPAVVTVVKSICSPRMPSIAGVRFGESAPVDIKTAKDVGADPKRCGLAGSPTQVIRVFLPERNRECTWVSGTAEEQALALKQLLETRLPYGIGPDGSPGNSPGEKRNDPDDTPENSSGGQAG